MDLGFQVHFRLSMCAAVLTFTVLHGTGAPHPNFLKMTNAYDLWLDPSDAVFQFEAGARILWDQITVPGFSTTMEEMQAFLEMVVDVEAIIEKGRPAYEDLRGYFSTIEKHVLQLVPPKEDGWDGRILMFPRPPAGRNMSILCHWLLREQPEFQVVATFSLPYESGEFSVSYRSRPNFNLLKEVPGAQGHRQAAGGVLKAIR